MGKLKKTQKKLLPFPFHRWKLQSGAAAPCDGYQRNWLWDCSPSLLGPPPLIEALNTAGRRCRWLEAEEEEEDEEHEEQKEMVERWWLKNEDYAPINKAEEETTRTGMRNCNVRAPRSHNTLLGDLNAKVGNATSGGKKKWDIIGAEPLMTMARLAGFCMNNKVR